MNQNNESTAERYQREQAADHMLYSKMTPAEIEKVFIDLHNEKCKTDSLTKRVSELEAMLVDSTGDDE